MMRTGWVATVNVAEVWGDDSLSLHDKAKRLAALLNACPLADDYLESLTEDLIYAGADGDTLWFDAVWNVVYDWADDNRVWIDVHGKVT